MLSYTVFSHNVRIAIEGTDYAVFQFQGWESDALFPAYQQKFPGSRIIRPRIAQTVQ
jgi:hypothetical protein